MPTKNKRPVSPLEAWHSEELGLSRSEFAALIERNSENVTDDAGDFARRIAAIEAGFGGKRDEAEVFGPIRRMTSPDFARDLLQRQQAFAAERAKARDDAVKARGAD